MSLSICLSLSLCLSASLLRTTTTQIIWSGYGSEPEFPTTSSINKVLLSLKLSWGIILFQQRRNPCWVLAASPFPGIWYHPVTIPSSSFPTAIYFYFLILCTSLTSPPDCDATTLISSSFLLPPCPPLLPSPTIILLSPQCMTGASSPWSSFYALYGL